MVQNSSSNDNAIQHLIFFLREINADSAPILAISIVEHLPIDLLDSFILGLLHARIIHWNFLHTLTIGKWKMLKKLRRGSAFSVRRKRMNIMEEC